jgi:hypothetical protein
MPSRLADAALVALADGLRTGPATPVARMMLAVVEEVLERRKEEAQAIGDVIERLAKNAREMKGRP